MDNKENELTANSLKANLWETLLLLRAKKIPPAVALAIAANAREIMRVVKAELAISAATGTSPNVKMIGTKSPTDLQAV